jgi:hypothetical protein
VHIHLLLVHFDIFFLNICLFVVFRGFLFQSRNNKLHKSNPKCIIDVTQVHDKTPAQLEFTFKTGDTLKCLAKGKVTKQQINYSNHENDTNYANYANQNTIDNRCEI